MVDRVHLGDNVTRRYAQHYPKTMDKSATDALGDFKRFPKWWVSLPSRVQVN